MDSDSDELARVRRLNAEQLRHLANKTKVSGGFLNLAGLNQRGTHLSGRSCTCGSPLVHALVSALESSD
jgi:hypothetical protein